MTAMFELSNNGPELDQTNYWDSPFAKDGRHFLTWNAGVARVLIPDCRMNDLPDMAAAKEVIVSQGPWRERGGQIGWELLFDDRSNAPFCLHLSQDQTDAVSAEVEHGAAFKIAIWSRNGKQLQLSARFRRVTAIPYLEPWHE